MKFINLFFVSILTLAPLTAPAADIYVNDGAVGSNSGISWFNAYTSLQDALDAASSGDTIHVAAGTYYPDEGTSVSAGNRSATFSLKNGVNILGGYPTNPAFLSVVVRNPSTHTTSLSGDIDQDGAYTYNSYHVVTAGNSINNTAILDGFTIERGYANAGSGSSASRGGGLLLSGSPTILNCRISNNIAFDQGGGIYTNASPVITSSTILGNTATNRGGGIYTTGSSATLTNTILQRNTAVHGGGAYHDNSPSASYENCSFAGNSTTVSGGGIYNNNGSTIVFTNCLILGNHSNESGGGAYNINNSHATFTNCTIQGNKSSSGDGGGIYNDNSNIALKNTIIWNNSAVNTAGAAPTPGYSLTNVSSTPSYSYCLVEFWNPTGTGNIDGTNTANDPLFVRETNLANSPTTSGNITLKAASPALNAGLNSANITSTDLNGNVRQQGNRIDMGAVEQSVIYVNDTATGSNNGSSWSNAYQNLQDALQASNEYSAIYVAAGSYYPDQGGTATADDPTARFAIKKGTSLLGGYPENSALLLIPIPNPSLHTTILSGDLTQDDATGGSGPNSTNSLISISTNSDVLINGFTVTGARNNSAFQISRNCRIEQCIFNHNQATTGGAILISNTSSDSITIHQCRFESNTSSTGGGAISLSSNTTCTISNSSFKENSATLAGGAIVTGGNTQLINCEFLGNQSPNAGAISCIGGTGSPETLITNCSFQGNASSSTSACIEFSNTTNSTLSNCILWNNGGASYRRLGGTVTTTYSLIQGSGGSANWNSAFGTDGGNNYDLDPDFITEVDPATAPTTGGDLRLRSSSPAFDSGDNSANSTSIDVSGNTRIIHFTIDRGAHEIQNPDLETLWTTDHDGDGVPYGVEFATGTQPSLPDRSAYGHLTTPQIDSNGDVFVDFGLNPNANGTVEWVLYQSTDLQTFTEIFRLTNTSGVPTITDPTISYSGDGSGGIRVFDLTPLSGTPNAFFRLAAEYVTP